MSDAFARTGAAPARRVAERASAAQNAHFSSLFDCCCAYQPWRGTQFAPPISTRFPLIPPRGCGCMLFFFHRDSGNRDRALTSRRETCRPLTLLRHFCRSDCPMFGPPPAADLAECQNAQVDEVSRKNTRDLLLCFTKGPARPQLICCACRPPLRLAQLRALLLRTPARTPAKHSLP